MGLRKGAKLEPFDGEDYPFLNGPQKYIFVGKRVKAVPPFKKRPTRRKAKAKTKTVRKDPLFVDGERPRPMYVDYKDVELLKKLVNRHSRIVGRRKTGCTAVSQHAVSDSIKRARFMALLPYVGD